ncbi:hypothetical protein MDA_GLEAN10019459 [Myotis davidii]|uniref:Uncharacterized protein n=1 Tax=Myotis davidii TaxID=225400 RepID=L5LCU4_MYODS|nr:hypothetical protein MDA_GLEAN10019459 [Myotis davidii]
MSSASAVQTLMAADDTRSTCDPPYDRGLREQAVCGVTSVGVEQGMPPVKPRDPAHPCGSVVEHPPMNQEFCDPRLRGPMMLPATLSAGELARPPPFLSPDLEDSDEVHQGAHLCSGSVEAAVGHTYPEGTAVIPAELEPQRPDLINKKVVSDPGG